MTRVLEVENYDGIIVFVRTKKETEEVADKLKARGFGAAAINGDIPSSCVSAPSMPCVTAASTSSWQTDVAARGLDVERISLVVNYDIPTTPSPACTASVVPGRRSRRCSNSSSPREKYMLRQIEKATRQKVEPMHMPTAEAVNETRKQRLHSRLPRPSSLRT